MFPLVLSELIKEIGMPTVMGPVSLEINRITHDSRQAGPGSLFVALPGLTVDGHNYISEAVAKGTRAVILEKARLDSYASLGCTLIGVADSRVALAQASAHFYGRPSEKLGVIGVTGTNGKTTVTYLIEAILTAWGERTGVIGTVNYRFRGRTLPANCTTPESVELQSLLSQMSREGLSWVVMEVSSHALELKRVEECHFDGAVFTSFSQDHLDFHGQMESYFQAKRRLFLELLPRSRKGERKFAAVNMDDPRGLEFAQGCSARLFTYGQRPGAAIRLANFRASLLGLEGETLTPQGPIKFESPLLGRFNAYNLLAAIAVGAALEIPREVIAQGIAAVEGVPGRMERIDSGQDFTVVVDYAHTEDALKRALSACREICAGRLILLFGCGGNRDRGKRPLMGKVAAQHADITVVSSDNPRWEEPEAIIEEILPGLEGVKKLTPRQARRGKKGYLVLPDRKEAIQVALSLAQEGDLVLLTGKGHEDYQIIGTNRLHLDDREEARAALKARLEGQ